MSALQKVPLPRERDFPPSPVGEGVTVDDSYKRVISLVLSEKWVENPVLVGQLCSIMELVTDPPATMETESLTSKIAESATAQKNR